MTSSPARRLRTALLSVLLCSALPGLQAQPPTAAPAAPTDPQARVPAAQHRSVIPPRPPRLDAEPGDWAAHNAQVARVGGWRTYAREAAAAAASAASAASAAAVTKRVAP